MRGSLVRSFKERLKKLSGYYLRQSIVKYTRQEELTDDEMKRLNDWLDHGDTRKELFFSLNQSIDAIKELEIVAKKKAGLNAVHESLSGEKLAGSNSWVNMQAMRIIKAKIKNSTEKLILIQIISRTIELIIKGIVLLIFLFVIIEMIRK